MMIDTDPFPEAPINMINLTWAKKGKWKGHLGSKNRNEGQLIDQQDETIKLPEKPKVTIVKGVVLCIKCQCECELEVASIKSYY